MAALELRTVRVGNKIRVGMFALYRPHYRFGVFRRLATTADISFVFHSPSSTPGSFLMTAGGNLGFAFVETRTKRVRLPIIGKVVTLQPYAVWSMLKGEFDVYLMACDFLRPSVWWNLLLSRLLGRKVCLWGQGISRPPSRLSWILRGMLFRLAHAVVFYTDDVRQMWLKRGVSAEKMFVAYNALDTDVSEALTDALGVKELERFKQEAGLAGKRLVIFCGRLMLDWKRPDVFVRAMKTVIEYDESVHAVIIGDGPMKKSLQELAAELGVSESVTFTGAIHDEPMLARYFLNSELAVIPAAAGLGILHAFGYGVPVVVGDDMVSHGPEIELLTDGVTGIMCRDGDVSSFARAICRLLRNDDEREKMSENALKVIHEKHNIDNMAAGVLAAVRFCLQKR